jgi:hypothetical protein
MNYEFNLVITPRPQSGSSAPPVGSMAQEAEMSVFAP